jgi:hypothetical protein
MKPIKLTELIDAVELDFEEHVSYVDVEDGKVLTVERSLLSSMEEGDEEAVGDVPDWQKAEVEIAKAIAQDAGGRFVRALRKYDFHEYRHMERFIGSLDSSNDADQLWRAIKGKGAFRYFKDTAQRLGLLEKWFLYRDDALKEFVIDWAGDEKIAFEDDVKPRAQG